MVKSFLLAKWYVKELNIFQSISILIIIFIKNKSNNTVVYLKKMRNGNINMIFNYLNDVVPYYLKSISQAYFSSLTPLNFRMEEHDNLMYESNRG